VQGWAARGEIGRAGLVSRSRRNIPENIYAYVLIGKTLQHPCVHSVAFRGTLRQAGRLFGAKVNALLSQYAQ